MNKQQLNQHLELLSNVIQGNEQIVSLFEAEISTLEKKMDLLVRTSKDTQARLLQSYIRLYDMYKSSISHTNRGLKDDMENIEKVLNFKEL